MSCDFTTVNSFLRFFRLCGGCGKWGIGLKSIIIHLVFAEINAVFWAVEIFGAIFPKAQ